MAKGKKKTDSRQLDLWGDNSEMELQTREGGKPKVTMGGMSLSQFFLVPRILGGRKRKQKKAECGCWARNEGPCYSCELAIHHPGEKGCSG